MNARYDTLGRPRAEGQERGLRPLHPLLPENWISRAVRISMSDARWQQFDALIGKVKDFTGARAAGQVLSQFIDAHAKAAPTVHWLDWEHEKAKRVLKFEGTAA
jgi:hypothetical protein